MLLPITGLSSRSAVRVNHGRFMMSQTSRRWYVRGSTCSASSTPTAHLSHQYGEWSAWAWSLPSKRRPARSSFPDELVAGVDAHVAALDLVVGVGKGPADLLG